MSNEQYLTVTALTKYIKQKFDVDPHLQNLYLKGEISNFTKHSSGHMYFTLKDDQTRISAIMFARNNRQLSFKPESGMKVFVRGNVSVFERDGRYQIYVTEMLPDGIGNLYLAYQQLLAKLKKEGLFLEEHKKKLPKYPQTVGVITSSTGAAVRDIINTIERRYPLCKIILLPAIVQGERAAKSIVKAIEQAHQLHLGIDVLIVGRGGGSIEELWAFNEEIVARAIFAAQIPIISAVGHETDYTIADHVSDVRAATPTAAAEIAVPNLIDIFEVIKINEERLTRKMTEKISSLREQLHHLDNSYGFRYPKLLYEQNLEQVDRLTEQLYKNSERVIINKKQQSEDAMRRLKAIQPQQLIKQKQEQLFYNTQQLNQTITTIVTNEKNRFQLLLATLGALNPLKIMERGYSVAYDEQDNIVKSIATVKQSDQIKIHVVDGKLHCEVLQIEEGKERDRGE